MKTVNKYINYLNEIMQDHYENNKSIYSDETPEWQKVDRMNNKIMWMVRDFFDKKKFKISFVEWLKQCPVDYDEIQQTSDDDVITINFHGKNIYQITLKE